MSNYGCSRNLIIMICIAALATACAATQRSNGPAAAAPMDSLVTTEWLAEHLKDPDLVVLDCSVHIDQDKDGLKMASGRADFEEGHIPGAGFADLMGDLADADRPIKYALPSPEAFASVMGALGVGDDSRVVLYDSFGSGWASRVWWMLRWVGFDRAAILDGGLRAWKAENRPLSAEPAERPARTLTPVVRPELIADRDEVLAAIDNDAVWIIDAMPEASFKGQMNMYGRPGHIPGATNIPHLSLLDESGRFRPPEELAALHKGSRNRRSITYCGGGISASANAFVMTRLGFTDVAVYTASLQEWASDPSNPLVTEE